jgi:hypothetical protein
MLTRPKMEVVSVDIFQCSQRDVEVTFTSDEILFWSDPWTEIVFNRPRPHSNRVRSSCNGAAAVISVMRLTVVTAVGSTCAVIAAGPTKGFAGGRGGGDNQH